MSGALLVLVRIHPGAYLCTVVMGHIVFNTANESQKLMLTALLGPSFSHPSNNVLLMYCCCYILRILYSEYIVCNMDQQAV